MLLFQVPLQVLCVEDCQLQRLGECCLLFSGGRFLQLGQQLLLGGHHLAQLDVVAAGLLQQLALLLVRQCWRVRRNRTLRHSCCCSVVLLQLNVNWSTKILVVHFGKTGFASLVAVVVHFEGGSVWIGRAGVCKGLANDDH